MAKQVNYHMQAKARAFAETFPIGSTVDVEKVDIWFIDQELVSDPGTDDTKSVAHKGFVNERNSARRALNTAAATLNGGSFQLVVKTPGKTYGVVDWTEDAKTFTRQLGDRIHKFSKGRFDALKSLHNQVERMRLEDDSNDELQETHEMLSYMRTQGVTLVSQVKGLVAQYNAAADVTESEIRRLIEARKQIEDKSSEES